MCSGLKRLPNSRSFLVMQLFKLTLWLVIWETATQVEILINHSFAQLVDSGTYISEEWQVDLIDYCKQLEYRFPPVEESFRELQAERRPSTPKWKISIRSCLAAVRLSTNLVFAEDHWNRKWHRAVLCEMWWLNRLHCFILEKGELCSPGYVQLNALIKWAQVL